MAKFEVTPELAATIKSVRTQNGVAAKAVAEHIHKSPAYISKLENGAIKTIDESVLTSILKFVYSKIENGKASLDTVLEDIYNKLSLRYSDDELNKQLWWDTYDTVMRRIPIPDTLVDDICAWIAKLDVSLSVLCQRINANEGIYPRIKNEDQYPFNIWLAETNAKHELELLFIKNKIREEDIDDILTKRVRSSNYMSLLAVVYYLKKIEEYGSQIEISDDDNTRLMQESYDYLNSHKFFSIAQKSKLARLAKTEEEREFLISSFDRENRELLNRILSAYKIFSDFDIQRSNASLAGYASNLAWDTFFMMALTSCKFHDIGKMSFSNKAKLLADIRRLIRTYADLPEEQREIEDYSVYQSE